WDDSRLLDPHAHPRPPTAGVTNASTMNFARVARLASLGLLALLWLGFALVGVLSVIRETPVSRVVSIGEDGGRIAVSDTAFVWTLGLLTGTPVRGGHQVEILNDGEETFPRLWNDLRAARRS